MMCVQIQSSANKTSDSETDCTRFYDSEGLSPEDLRRLFVIDKNKQRTIFCDTGTDVSRHSPHG